MDAVSMTKRERDVAGWNYRVMRHAAKAANDDDFYAVHEVYYRADGTVKEWTKEPSGSPTGETHEEMSRDLAWIITALTKPTLDHATGLEVEPAMMLADDIGKVLRDKARKEAHP
jgi:hypothetical protein